MTISRAQRLKEVRETMKVGDLQLRWCKYEGDAAQAHTEIMFPEPGKLITVDDAKDADYIVFGQDKATIVVYLKHEKPNTLAQEFFNRVTGLSFDAIRNGHAAKGRTNILSNMFGVAALVNEENGFDMKPKYDEASAWLEKAYGKMLGANAGKVLSGNSITREFKSLSKADKPGGMQKD